VAADDVSGGGTKPAGTAAAGVSGGAARPGGGAGPDVSGGGTPPAGGAGADVSGGAARPAGGATEVSTGGAWPAGTAVSASASPRAGLDGSELLRKATHVGMGAIAFALRPLGPLWSALLAAVALLFNLFLLHRIGGRRMWRDHEHAAGASAGIVLYPLSVLLLILVFQRRLEIAAAAWGILAFGDGLATVFGIAFGRRKLPWNPSKSWVGTAAYVVFGTLAAAALLFWTAPERGYGWAFALAAGGAAALLAAALESLPQGLDDNLGVPMVSALFLLGMVLTQGRWQALLAGGLPGRLLAGAAINAALAAVAYAARTIDLSGVVAGFLLGTAIYGCLGWRGFLLLAAFFVIGSACTRFGYQKKAAERIAQEAGGRRGARHALANAGVAAACALFAAATPYPGLFAVAFAAALATAAGDTASSEIGQVLGRRTYLATTLRPVPRGTEGAVSLEGTLAGLAASGLVAALGAAAGLYGWGAAAAVTGGAFAGTTLESIVGAALERRRLLDNEALNFLNTLLGALAAVGIAVLAGVELAGTAGAPGAADALAAAGVQSAVGAAGAQGAAGAVGALGAVGAAGAAPGR
jgi:uncharacterized protein (TIGR00297 family)